MKIERIDVKCIEAIKSATMGKSGFEAYLVGNIIKYLWRYNQKNKIEDLQIAKWYVDKLVEYKEAEKLREEIEFAKNNAGKNIAITTC